jgi:hypothetical protein
MPGNEVLGAFLRWQAAAFSAGAAAMHFAEVSTHYEEWWLFGAFFLTVAWFQAVSAVAFVARSDRRLPLGITVVNLAVIGIWVWSRTTGLPIGPEAGEQEPIAAADLLATVLEGLLVVWGLAILDQGLASRTASRGLGVLTTALVWAAVAGMTALVFFSTTAEMAH